MVSIEGVVLVSCADCEQHGRIRRALIQTLITAAEANGYSLWARGEGLVEFELLAVPSGASYATPQALMEAFGKVRRGLPRHPGRKPEKPGRDTKRPRPNDDGMTTYRLDGTAPPILLTFIDKLS